MIRYTKACLFSYFLLYSVLVFLYPQFSSVVSCISVSEADIKVPGICISVGILGLLNFMWKKRINFEAVYHPLHPFLPALLLPPPLEVSFLVMNPSEARMGWFLLYFIVQYNSINSLHQQAYFLMFAFYREWCSRECWWQINSSAVTGKFKEICQRGSNLGEFFKKFSRYCDIAGKKKAEYIQPTKSTVYILNVGTFQVL